MSLLKIVQELDLLDKEGTIYATEPWAINSQAVVLREPESGILPPEFEQIGLKYFIEVFIANDFLKQWEQQLKTAPTLEQKCLRLIHYAINDA